jgi:hypothetical protein
MAIQAAMQYPEVGFGHDGGFAGKNGSPRSPFLDNFRIADQPSGVGAYSCDDLYSTIIVRTYGYSIRHENWAI